jgi:hypothetical protein
MSSKLSYSNFNNYNEFSFTIENNIKIKFPKLFSKLNNSNKTRFWYIYAFLLNSNTKEKININKSFTNLNKFNELVTNYTNLQINIYTKYGQQDGKITMTEPTIITEGKNIGKSNETSIFTQSLIHMRNLYLKKIKSGYELKISDIDDKKLYPMALQVYDKYKKYIEYPCYIQPKLDGIRLTAKIENENIILLSRRLNPFIGFDFIENEIKLLLEDEPNIILDGELYNHNISLQDISGIVRTENKNNKEKLQLQFYIFDCIDLKNNLTFEERYFKLKEIFAHKHFKYLVLLDTIKIYNEKESDEYFKQYVDQKFEGIIYKNSNAKYEYSNYKEIRSKYFLKRKKSYDVEYKIVDFTTGKNGKDKDAIIFIMEAENGKLFRSVPNDTLENRKNMYKLALTKFDILYKNKMATIKFDEYSNDNTPLRAKFITIRNYE